MNPLLYTDYYKTEHHRMYPEGTTMIYSNFTPRKSRIKGIDHVVVFGIQHFILEYLIKAFDEHFFHYGMHPEVGRGGKHDAHFKAKMVEEYKRHIPVDTRHIEALWDLGYLPIEIKALPEGTLCPIGVPVLTIRNTHKDFGWLTNYLETLLSCSLWKPITSATLAYEYKKLLTSWAQKTDPANVEFADWQGHDFSMRGMSDVNSAILSGMGHLIPFTGTDTIPAIYQLERSYGAKGLIGASVPATEHSVMCMGTMEDEIGTFNRLLKLYPKNVLSVVSDTWNLWRVVSPKDGICLQLKDAILARDGKLVIRPDSGNPVAIVCGLTKVDKKELNDLLFPIDYCYYEEGGKNYKLLYTSNGIKPVEVSDEEIKGVIECLWEVFGGTETSTGYKKLDSHIGCIYGDAITFERCQDICRGLEAKKFASTNMVFGIGSYTYNYNTRDTFGFAMKATYGELSSHRDIHGCKCAEGFQDLCKNHDENTDTCCLATEPREIYKNPVTDDGEKRSAKGLLAVVKVADKLELHDQRTWEQEQSGLLQTVFKDGKLVRETTLMDIRERLKSYEKIEAIA